MAREDKKTRMSAKESLMVGFEAVWEIGGSGAVENSKASKKHTSEARKKNEATTVGNARNARRRNLDAGDLSL